MKNKLFSSTLLFVLLLCLAPSALAKKAHLASVSHGAADYCTVAEYTALGGNAAAVGIQCRNTHSSDRISQVRRNGNVVAYMVNECTWREHNGNWDTYYGNTQWHKTNHWTRFSPKRCRTVRQPA